MTEPQPFSAARILSELKGFQANTVEHIMQRFYGPDATDRFLVADETGLGKTIVARGVIARTIEELQHNDAVKRIDIVYVCSNLDLAHQNLQKLNVIGDKHHGIASRLTLLAKHSRNFAPMNTSRLIKPVNLVSFTPGTSFSKGWNSGTAEERAMIYLLLEERLQLADPCRAHSARRVLQGTLHSPDRLADYISDLKQELKSEIDPTVSEAFLKAADDDTLLDQFEYLVEHIDEIEQPRLSAWPLVGALRAVLARESVRLLTPDLVILDEFQRFRELLNENSEAGELAHHLFQFRDLESDHRAKVLLLSATPFKPFTYAEEARMGDDHHRDFLEVVKFLANGEETHTTRRVADALSDYRSAVVTGRAANDLTDNVRTQLLQVMARTERPRSVTAQMSEEYSTSLETPPEEDLLGFVALRRLARHVNAPFSIEYWKSAPYFINFMDGYKIGDSVRAALDDPDEAASVTALLDHTQQINFNAVRRYAPINPGNARMQALADATLKEGWWKLLWIPPSLTYLVPGGPFAEEFAQTVTKRLIFSSWTATPTAVATLLSYAADRLGAGDILNDMTPAERTKERNSRRSRLAYRIDREGDRDRPSSMSTLAIFWPMPGLAAIADPRRAEFHRGSGTPLEPHELQSSVAGSLRFEHHAELEAESTGSPASHWYEALRRTDSVPNGLSPRQIQDALSGSSESDDDRAEPSTDTNDQEPAAHQHNDLRARHIQQALHVNGSPQDRPVTEETINTMARVAAHSPANIAYRALHRVSHDQPEVTSAGLWTAAARLSSALRSLFSRPETVLLLDQLITDDVPYWRKVLQYCAWGNLQAVLDEYIHHLNVSLGSPELDDTGVMDVAHMAATALELRSTSYEVFNPNEPSERPKFWGRFALRFGGRRDNQESARQPLVRQAFNSPFWPFVLASTSVGQEGVDFHWWSHAVLHWNTPANPIDFEQREGRIDRYDGHAVRKNIAARHGSTILTSDDPNPWREAYRLAQDEVEDLGEFAPHWVYPGDAHIERHVAPFPLSIDGSRLADIKRDVALYRLTFGQPRQEDMLELIRSHYSQASPADLEALRLDLSAPQREPVTATRDDEADADL